jgi:catechol-2,3-dioxygenase
MRLGEVVLRTGHYDVMKDWYRTLLGIDPSLEHASKSGPSSSDPSKPSRMCFFRLHVEHPYQDVIAIFEMRDTRSSPTCGPGLHHMQLRNASLENLCERYRRLRKINLMPEHAMDHGPSTSLYYRDPDRNLVEIAASNFATPEEVEACLASETYQRNPAGIIIDPESLLQR